MKALLLLLLLLLARLFSHPAAAQTPTALAPDSSATTVAAQTAYLTDALRLSTQQRLRVAALLQQQQSCPTQPVPPAAWLRVLTLNQYQAWQNASVSSSALRIACPALRTAPLLASRAR